MCAVWAHFNSIDVQIQLSREERDHHRSIFSPHSLIPRVSWKIEIDFYFNMDPIYIISPEIALKLDFSCPVVCVLSFTGVTQDTKDKTIFLDFFFFNGRKET